MVIIKSPNRADPVTILEEQAKHASGSGAYPLRPDADIAFCIPSRRAA
jgi:hypothetical protein